MAIRRKTFVGGVDTEGIRVIQLNSLSYVVIMPFGKYEPTIKPPLPTFFQYIRTIGKGVEGKTKFQVDIIWLPGKFNNVTLQTHAFRYQCSEDHPLYGEIQEYLQLEISKGSSPRLDIVIDSIEDKTIDLTENPKVGGTWEKMGTSAFRFKNP